MLLVDARGVPLSITVSAANRNYVTQLASTLDAIVALRPAWRHALVSTWAEMPVSSALRPSRTCSTVTTSLTHVRARMNIIYG